LLDEECQFYVFVVVAELQIGAGQRKAKQLTKPELGHFKAAGVPLKQHLAEFPVTEDAILPVGTELTVRHFQPGQYVDIAGITTGKGFQVLSNTHIVFLSYSDCFWNQSGNLWCS
jgi:ribosomal protein L3